MMNKIKKRLTDYLFDKDTGNMLNYLTLNVYDK